MKQYRVVIQGGGREFYTRHVDVAAHNRQHARYVAQAMFGLRSGEGIVFVGAIA